ncbi:cupin domain-containing protein [Laceyella putida]|uniref:Cupin domain-containing protein n=1 Tax=Laceyella putida TaxID=110101 RepID=A0ABW2RKM5_9BACL
MSKKFEVGVNQVNKTYAIRSNERDYIQVGCGVSLSYLRKEVDDYSLLLKMEPGSRFPMHGHRGGEQIFVVSGHVQIGEMELHQGDYFFTPLEYTKSLETKDGCTLLVSSTKEVDASRLSSHADTTV